MASPLKSDPLKAIFDQIHKQANYHKNLVNAYAAYAQKLKLENSKQLRIFADLAQTFSDVRANLFEQQIDRP